MTVRQVVLSVNHIYRPRKVWREWSNSEGQELANCETLLSRFGQIEGCWLKIRGPKRKIIDFPRWNWRSGSHLVVLKSEGVSSAR